MGVMAGFAADGQERIPEDVFGAEKVILLMHGDRIHGQEELPRGCEREAGFIPWSWGS